MALEQATTHLGNAAAAMALTWPSLDLGLGGSPAGSGPPTILPPVETPEFYEQSALRGKQEIRRVKAVKTVVAGLLIAVWALGSYSADFVGTMPEMIKIFFAAFTLDVTLDALTAKVKG